MKTTLQLVTSAIIALGFVSCSGEKNEPNKLANTETIAVKTHTLASAQTQLNFTATGLLTTENEARYSFKIGGVVDKIFVEEGESFKKGKLLAALKLDEIEAGYQQAKLGLEKAERDLKRVQNLFRDSVATREQLQNTQTAFDIASQQLAALAFNKENAAIYAAADGFVTRKIANVGENVSGGIPILAINENVGNAWVLQVGLSDKKWAAVQLGDSADVYLDAYPDRIIQGIVSNKSLAADQNSGSFILEIRLQLGSLQPAIGMFGKALMRSNDSWLTQTIPYEALIEANGKKAFVFVPQPQGRVKKQAIQIAHFDKHGVYVQSGLEGVKEVVLSNSAFLNEKSKIKILN